MTNLLQSLLSSDSPEPFALLAREGRGVLEVLTGEIIDVDTLAAIPLGSGDDAPEVLALVPYRQIVERGYQVRDDHAPLRCLIVREREEMPLAEALALLPREAVPSISHGFDITDEDYADIVTDVIENEIGRGEGANFVVRRDFLASTELRPDRAALAWLRSLLTLESGAYWTFAVFTPGLTTVGATPERHVSLSGGTVTMNPISGTFRHPAEGPSVEAFADFLADAKETEELFMVVDEELKMMSAVCAEGGHIEGPFLKQMSQLTHTEYLLTGQSDMDPRDILRETMFAPTVTGSPMENACAVIARHESTPRGYYSGVIALFSPVAGGYDLDAPILIRTAYLVDGEIRVPAGATLVRHSVPESEVKETHAKAAGLLGALGMTSRPPTPPETVQLAENAELLATLQSRNERLAPFWLNEQSPTAVSGALNGKRALVVDAEDRFTTMLGHQLRHLGMQVEIRRWNEVTEPIDADLLVAGPGPGDPRRHSSARIATMSRLIRERYQSGRPLLAVCLSHQILAAQLGMTLAVLPAPRQGVQLSIDLFGTRRALGFYNTFTARTDAGTRLPEGVSAAVDSATGDVFALRGPGFASVQGHVESVLSRDGIAALEALASHAVATATD